MTYLEEYKEGNKFSGIYLCKSKQILKTKAGKTYYSLILQDKTGIIDGKVWELNAGIAEFDSMDFIMTVHCNIISGSPSGKHKSHKKSRRG